MKDESLIKYIKSQLFIFKGTRIQYDKDEHKYAEEVAKKIINKIRTGKAYPNRRRKK